MARVRKRQGEKLEEANIKKAILLLESENPITKKEACELLNISYNTKRLNTIIEDFKHKEEYRAKRRKELANKPVSDIEKADIIKTYLATQSISAVSDSSFRSTDVIKKVLKEFSIPVRDSSFDYWNPPMLEEESYSENYEKGDLVFAARYYSVAYVEKPIKKDNVTTYYSIYIHGPYERYAIQPAYELADLRRLQKLGVNPSTTSKEDIIYAINEALLKAKKMKDKK